MDPNNEIGPLWRKRNDIMEAHIHLGVSCHVWDILFSEQGSSSLVVHSRLRVPPPARGGNGGGGSVGMSLPMSISPALIAGRVVELLARERVFS